MRFFEYMFAIMSYAWDVLCIIEIPVVVSDIEMYIPVFPTALVFLFVGFVLSAILKK